MGDTVDGKKRWVLKAELVVLVCAFCIWLTMLVAANFTGVQAAAIKEIVEINPNNAHSHESPVDPYFESRDHEVATEDYEQVMRVKAESNASAHLILGDSQCDADRPERANESYIATARSNPDSFEAHDNLAAAYMWLERCEDAIEFLEDITRITAGDADPRLTLGNACCDADYPEEAIDRHKAVIRLDPDCFDAHLVLGTIYHGSGRCEEAIECFQEAVRIMPDSAWAHIYLGLAYSDCGRYEEAVEVYKQVILLEPYVLGLNLLLGQAYFKMGHYEQAMASYEKVVDAEPDRAQARYNLAEVYLKMSNRDLALEEYEILRILDEELAEELLCLLQE